MWCRCTGAQTDGLGLDFYDSCVAHYECCLKYTIVLDTFFTGCWFHMLKTHPQPCLPPC